MSAVTVETTSEQTRDRRIPLGVVRDTKSKIFPSCSP